MVETALLDMPERVALEGRSSGLDLQTPPEEDDLRIESEYEDDLLMSLAWIKNIG